MTEGTRETTTGGTRERFLAATARLLQERGYRGTSLNDILSESGAPRGSLYHHFPGGKEQLAREATRREVRMISEYLVAAFRESASPAEAIHRYVEGAREHLRNGGFLVGCPVSALVLDSPEASSSIREMCDQALAEWQAILRDGLANGGIPTDRVDSLATLILSSVEGALILARSRGDPGPLDTVADELAATVSDALAEAPGDGDGGFRDIR